MNTTAQELLPHSTATSIPVQYNDRHPAAPASDPASTPAEVPAESPDGRPDPPVPPTEPPASPEPPKPPRPGRIPLPRYLTRFLRSIAGVDLAAGVWLLLVGAHRVPCITRLCNVATLDGKHEVAGLTAVTAALLLAGAALFTSGLTRADSATATILIGIALTGLLAAIGVVLAAAIVLSVIGLALGAVIGVMVGAVRGDLTR